MTMEDFDLDTVLLKLPSDIEWTARNAVEGVQIFGGIGSGKTSGPGRMLALKYLSAGFGGLVLTVKPDEKAAWEEYCALTGRSDDLLVVEPGSGNFFNFLDYESRSDEAMSENLAQVMKTVIRARAEKATGGGNDPFWQNAEDMLLLNIIDLCRLAYGKVSVKLMYDIVRTLPHPQIKSDNRKAFDRALDRAHSETRKKTEAWESQQGFDALKRMKDEGTYDECLFAVVPEVWTLRFVDEFFLSSFRNLNEKTRSIIELSFSGFLFKLLREPIFSMFCNRPSTFTPEASLDGKIILLNLPVKKYHEVGQDVQIMFKYIWQRVMEKRNIKKNGRPVFLWADEAQNFLHEHDPDFQATARSSRVATVYISQNIPNYHANMGSTKSSFKVNSFLGTLATKIFNANADIETNKYASELIGEGEFYISSDTQGYSGGVNLSETTSRVIERIVRPETFSGLKTGGPRHNFKVEAYLHFQSHHPHYVKTSFSQK